MELCGYVAFYRGKRTEVLAGSSYAALKAAAEVFEARKASDVTVVLAEKDGKPVVHLPLF